MSELLTTYLQDHHAASVAGVEAFERVAGNHGDPAVRTEVQQIATDIREDHQALETVMDAAGAKRSLVKDSVGRLGEVAARLKPNERLVKRSPLSDLIELEALVMAVEGKCLLWEALQVLGDPRVDAGETSRLAERAADQRRRLNALRVSQVAKLRQD